MGDLPEYKITRAWTNKKTVKNKKTKTYIILFILIVIIGGIILFWKIGGRSFIVEESNNLKPENNSKQPEQGKANPITGIKCENYNRRPLAVMLAQDPVARPVSGISYADLVIEMLVTDNITRIMAVFVCENPEEIGPIRSSRHDFIPLAMGFDAIYVHWGGSHYALDKLNASIIDNIDALTNPYSAFWRKNYISAPHNGFTSMSRLINSTEKLGYRLENNFEGYPHIQISNSKFQISNGKLIIDYPYPYKVHYEYDSESNSYLRWRNNKPEIDRLNNEQVSVKNVVVIRAESRMIELPQYNDVDVEGTGQAVIYRNGQEIRGTWEKEGRYKPTKLYFLNSQGEEIKFVPGKIWIEIVNPTTSIHWQTQ